MLSTRLHISLVVLLLAALTGPDARGQRLPDGGRGGPRQQARAVVKSIDAKAGTITVTVPSRREEDAEKTYTLAKNVEVGTGSGGGRGALQEIKLADVAPGVLVSLGLSADEKTVEFILAEGPQVRGVLKSVAADKKTLTVAVQPTRRDEAGEEKTYTIAEDSEIGLDDGRGRRFSVKESKLADLPAGVVVTLWLSVDQNKVQGVQAEGPMLIGKVKEVNAGKNTLTLITRSREGEAEEKTLEVAKDALTLLDDGKGWRFSLKAGKLADVPAGAMVQLKLSADQKHVASLRAEGATLQGRIKAIDGAKGTITLDVFTGRRENPEEKSLTLAKDVRVLIEGKAGKLDDVKADETAFVSLRLSLDQKTVQGISVGRGRQ